MTTKQDRTALIAIQQIIDDLRIENDELSATIYRMTNVQVARKLDIRDLNVKIEGLLRKDRRTRGFLDKYIDIVANRDRTIEDLKDALELERIDHTAERTAVDRKYHDDLCKQIPAIEDLNSRLAETIAIVDKITLLRVDEVELRQDIDAELSARKHDSEVLMKVVEIVKGDSLRSYMMINQLADLLIDYIDAPESCEPRNMSAVITVTNSESK